MHANEDAVDSVKVQTLFLAEVVRVENAKLDVLGGVISWMRVPALPTQVGLSAVMIFDASEVDPAAPSIDVHFKVEDPDGQLCVLAPLAPVVLDFAEPGPPQGFVVASLVFEVSKPGRHVVTVRLGSTDHDIAATSIDIRPDGARPSA